MRTDGSRFPCSLVGVHPVGMSDGGLLSRVMSKVACTTFGWDESTCGLSEYHIRCSYIYFLYVLAYHPPRHFPVAGWHSVAYAPEGKMGKRKAVFPCQPGTAFAEVE